MVTWIKSKLQTVWAVITGIIIIAFLVMLFYIKQLKRQVEEAEGFKEINERNEAIRKDREKIQEAKDKFYEAITKKEKKEKDSLSKDKPTKWVWILIPLLFMGCHTRVVYEYIVVRDDIPVMMIYDNPTIDVTTPPPNEDGLICLEYSELNKIYIYVQELKELIEWYESDIQNYMRFRKIYNRRQ